MIQPSEISETEKRAHAKITHDLGPIIVELLASPEVIEIMVNPDGSIFAEKLGNPIEKVGYIAPNKARSIVTSIAGTLGKSVTEKSPLIEGELPLDGSRFTAQLPPVVSAPTFAIRKRAISVFGLADYEKNKILSATQNAFVKAAIAAKKNILVVGGTGTGKTTFVNALIQELSDQFEDARLLILEDTLEIQCASQNAVIYRTSLEVSLSQLLKMSLRMRPDRILVGEVRGSEALDLLMAWNTGHPGGVATLHANSAAEALTRLSSMISMNPSAPRELEPLIAAAVDLILFMKKTPEGRVVEEIISVDGYENGRYQTSNAE